MESIDTFAPVFAVYGKGYNARLEAFEARPD
jgi:hypothetical protein